MCWAAIGRCHGIRSPNRGRPRAIFIFFICQELILIRGATANKSSARHRNASQSSRRSCSFHAWASGSCAQDERAYWWCANVRVSTSGGRRTRWRPTRSRSILSTLLQKSSISLNLTATNLWLHYYRRCFILVSTRKPGAGLVNGEGDGEGDQPEPLLRYWVGWALERKLLALSCPFSILLQLKWSKTPVSLLIYTPLRYYFILIYLF